MAGRVHQVEDVELAVLGAVVEADRLRLDGDAALALDVHRIEHLRAHLALGEGAADLDQTVGEGRLAVVDMGDDGEVADVRRGRSCGGLYHSPASTLASAVRGPALSHATHS